MFTSSPSIVKVVLGPSSAGRLRLAAVAAALALVTLTSAGAAETLYSLLEKHHSARGGADAWQAVESIRIIGEMTVSDPASQTGAPVPVVMEILRPDKLRFEFELQGQQVVQAFDGEAGWLAISNGIEREVQDMSAGQAVEFARTADFDGPLIGWREKAFSLQYLGLDTEGTLTGHLVEVSRPDGETYRLVLDAETYLTVVEQVFSSSASSVPRVQTVLGDYRQVEGLALPFRYDIDFPADGKRQLLVVDSVDLNVPLALSRFQKPSQ